MERINTPENSWRYQLVTNTKEAEAFLEAQLKNIAKEQVCTTVSTWKNGFKFQAQTKSGTEYKTLLNLSLEFSARELIWRDILVGAYRGRHIASMCVKAAIGLARERGLTTIRLHSPTNTGCLFWTRLYAKPRAYPKTLKDYLLCQTLGNKFELNSKEHAFLQALGKHTKTNNKKIWHCLALSARKSDNMNWLCGHVMKETLGVNDLFINLQDPRTFRRLEYKLGRLTPEYRS